VNNTSFLSVTFSVVIVVAFIAITVYTTLLLKANKKQSKWGINFNSLKPDVILKCPSCDTQLPKVRKPTSLRQALWGGWTCKACGKEYDKWLNEIGS